MSNHCHIQQYEEQVREGKLLAVVNGDPEQTAEAQRVLRETNAEVIHFHATTSADSPEISDT